MSKILQNSSLWLLISSWQKLESYHNPTVDINDLHNQFNVILAIELFLLSVASKHERVTWKHDLILVIKHYLIGHETFEVWQPVMRLSTIVNTSPQLLSRCFWKIIQTKLQTQSSFVEGLKKSSNRNGCIISSVWSK